VAAASLVAAALLSYVWTSQSWFITDDFFNAYTARISSLDWDYLREGVYQHFAPGHRLVDWLLWREARFDWTVAMVFLYGALILSGGLLLAILDRLCGRRWWHLLVACWFVVSFVWVRSIQWWANGLHTVPGTLGTLAAVYCSIRTFESERSWRWPWLAAAGLAVGLAFYEKALLAVIYAPLLRLAVYTPKLTLRAVLDAVRREWRLWTVLATVAIPWFLYWSAEDYAGDQPNPSANLLQEYGRILWLRGFVPALLGVRVQADASTGEDVAIVAGQIALAAFVAWTVWRRRQAWRAWSFFAITFVLNAALLGVNRIVQFGTGIALDSRYATEYLPIFAIAAALATSSNWPRSAGAKRPFPDTRQVPTRAAAAAAALAALFLGLNALSSNGIADEWPAYKAERYYKGLRTSASEYKSRVGHPPAILDEPVIPEVLPAFLSPFNRARYVLPTLGVDVPYDTPADDLHAIDADGLLIPLKFAAAQRVKAARGCTRGPKSLEWVPEQPLSAPDTDLRLTGRSNARGAIPVYVDDTGQGLAPYDSGQIPTASGSFRSGLATGRSTVHALRLDVPPGIRLCVRRLEIGDWRPGGAARAHRVPAAAQSSTLRSWMSRSTSSMPNVSRQSG
jgi:hypothetical protein